MQIVIHCSGFPLTDPLAAHVQKRLGYALGRSAGKVRRVEVRLSDLNGPRGGIDKRCLVEVRLDKQSPVVVEDVQSELYAAIDRATGRAGRAVIRRVALINDRRRQHTPQDLRHWNHGL
ncbi:MAG: HPF/RaiA family ribosome-associated protein [Pseudomonadota bacterium]